MQTETHKPLTSKAKVALTAVVLPLILSACDADNQALFDPSALFSTVTTAAETDDSNATVTPTTQAPPAETPAANPTTTPTATPVVTPDNTPPATPVVTPVDDPLIITVDPIDPPVAPVVVTPAVEITPAGISPELALLTTGPITFSMLFDGATTATVDTVTFTEADFDVGDGDLPLLATIDDSGVIVCSFVGFSDEYLCLRAFDLQLTDRVWNLFSFDTASSGSGVFEFCDANDTDDVCTEMLFATPDGEVTVTIGAIAEFASLPAPAPYLAYENQATVSLERVNLIGLSADYADTVTALEKAINR